MPLIALLDSPPRLPAGLQMKRQTVIDSRAMSSPVRPVPAAGWRETARAARRLNVRHIAPADARRDGVDDGSHLTRTGPS